MSSANLPGIGAGTILRRDRHGHLACVQDEVAVEEPLEIRLGDEPVAVTMRTPGHDEELAAGFLLAEGIIRSRADIAETTAHESQSVVNARLQRRKKVHLPRQKRTISSSCGLCGKARLESIHQHFPPINKGPRVSLSSLLGLPERLRSAQANFDRTGGIHAAALFDLADKSVMMREDVGRHNAVDKVIGRALLDGLLPLTDHILMVSGRSSFEIVQKALAARIAIVASVSAPSSLAVNFAREHGITLIGFLRPPTFNIYSHVERLVL